MKRTVINSSVVKKHSKFKRLFINRNFISIVLIILSAIICMAASNYALYMKSENLKLATTIIITPQDSIRILNDSITKLRGQLSDEIHAYMIKVYPHTKMQSDTITNICLAENFDIPLLLSQAHLESQFGRRTGGTNSCFGVISKRFNDVNESIPNYVKIMKKSYVKNRSVEACIQHNFNVEGSLKYRYASNPIYGQTIGRIRSNIIRSTSITDYVEQINDLQQQIDSIQMRINIQEIPDYDPIEKDTANS